MKLVKLKQAMNYTMSRFKNFFQRVTKAVITKKFEYISLYESVCKKNKSSLRDSVLKLLMERIHTKTKEVFQESFLSNKKMKQNEVVFVAWITSQKSLG